MPGSGSLTLGMEAIDLLKIEPVCVRSGLYEVDMARGECYPVYWNQADKIQVMRGQWFVDGTWQPLEEEESNLIEQEHLNAFPDQQMQDTFDLEVAKLLDDKDDTLLQMNRPTAEVCTVFNHSTPHRSLANLSKTSR